MPLPTSVQELSSFMKTIKDKLSKEERNMLRSLVVSSLDAMYRNGVQDTTNSFLKHK